MKKKIFIGIGAFFILIIGSLVAIPLLFKDKIKAKIESTINENLDANVSFDEADLSLFKKFPQATISIKKFLIINKAPFKGDTLVAFDELNLQMSIKELFNGEKEPMKLDAISILNGKASIIFNKEGKGNFDIVKKDNSTQETSQSKPFSLAIQKYALTNFKLKYYDESSKIKLVIDSLDHEGSGNFDSKTLDLDTKSIAKISLDMDKMSYLKNVAITLDAILGINLEKSKYTFKKNKATINQLPLEFDGFIQMLPNSQLYNLTFKTPTTSFKNFLGLVPAAYAGNLNTVKTTGDFTINGKVDGELTDKTVPKFNIEIASNNASFQYPDLPKSVQKIIIDTHIVNETGIMNDTYVNLEKLSFQIDQDVFSISAFIKNIATNALVDATLKGTINLSNITKAYPVKLDKPLSGILKANITTNFDMLSVEKNQYQNIHNAGDISLYKFNYTGPEMAKPVQISIASILFNTSQIKLTQFDMKTGSSDLNLTGSLDNFYGFLFKKQILKANFNLSSNKLLVSDFMTPTPVNKEQPSNQEDKSKQNVPKEAIKIPSFLDCTISAKANTVVYDNLNLKNVSGKMTIKDESITLKDIKSSIFEGEIGFNGVVSTKNATPTFSMDLDLSKVDISQTFSQLDMLKKIAPIAGVINGKLNSTIKVSGNLDSKELTPDLKTISGDLIGQLLSTTVNPKNSALLSTLGSQVKFLDVSKLNLNDIKAFIAFKDGKVTIKPFKVKYQDINAEIGGSHGFDQNMDYDIKMDVPAKYLGSEANKLLAKLGTADAAKLENIPITALMTGTFKNPKISTDMKQATANLASQLVKSQKDKLLNQGKSSLGNIINGNKKTTTDTTKTKQENNIKNTANQVINGIFGKKK